MMRHRWIVWVVVLLLAVMGGIGFELARQRPAEVPVEAVAGTGPATLAGAIDYDALGRDLGGGDATARAAARDVLERVPYQERDRLQRWIDDATDAEVRGLLVRRLEAIDRELTLHPPVISLHVQEAPLYDVVTALNEEMGTHIVWQASDAGQHLFTLHAEGKPFWEVITALNAQHPLTVLTGGALTIQEATEPATYQSAGAFLVGIRPHIIRFDDGGGGPMVRYVVWCDVAVDPRVRMTGVSLGWVLGPDDLGNEVWPANQARVTLRPLNGAGFSESRWLQNWKPAATRISRVTVTIRAAAVLRTAWTEVDYAERGVATQVGDVQITGVPLVRKEGSVTAVFKSLTKEGVARAARYRLIDGNGVAHTGASDDGGVATIGCGEELAAPYRLEVWVPVEMRDASVVSEMKEVGYPRP